MSLDTFFRNFEKYNNRGDIAALASCFAETFMIATREQQQVILTRDFIPAIAKRKKQFEELGERGSELISLEERQLDNSYWWADTQWKFTFSRERGDVEVITRSGFLLHVSEVPRIVFYVPQGDPLKLLNESEVQSAGL